METPSWNIRELECLTPAWDALFESETVDWTGFDILARIEAHALQALEPLN